MINARMFVEAIERISGDMITRVRMQCDRRRLFMTELHGELEASHLTETAGILQNIIFFQVFINKISR